MLKMCEAGRHTTIKLRSVWSWNWTINQSFLNSLTFPPAFIVPFLSKRKIWWLYSSVINTQQYPVSWLYGILLESRFARWQFAQTKSIHPMCIKRYRQTRIGLFKLQSINIPFAKWSSLATKYDYLNTASMKSSFYFLYFVPVFVCSWEDGQILGLIFAGSCP